MSLRRRGTRELPDLGLYPPPEPTVAELCPPGEAHEEQNEIRWGGIHRVIERQRFWDGKLIEFAITRERWVAGQWVTVMRADTAHGQAHIHVFDSRGEEVSRQVVMGISDFGSVVNSYDECCELVYELLEVKDEDVD